MTYSTSNLLADQSTAAQFRAWGSAISAAFAAIGMVQTADTGQINWTTVAAPASTNASQGYEVWRFNDALQSSAPVYFKVEYGSGAAARCPQMWVTVGTGSDGAGTITGTNVANVFGAVTTRRTLLPPNTSTVPAATSTCYFNGDSGSVAFLLWPNINSSWGGGVLVIERHRLWDGSNTADGVTLFVAASDGVSPSNSANGLFYTPGLLNPAVATGAWNSWTLGPAVAMVTCNVGGTLYPTPIPTGALRSSGPSKYILALGQGDLPAGATFTMNHYGGSHSWIAAGMGNTAAPGWAGTASPALKSFVFRTD